jgi:galactonate dehydratase
MVGIRMKITEVTTYTPCEERQDLDTTYYYPLTLVKIDTDEGISGVGEGTLETKCLTVATCIKELGDGYLLDKDPLRIERHWQAMYRGSYWTGGPVINSAISAIEAALWDIAGKNYNTPIHNLLGGRYRDKIKCYTGVGGATPEELADNVESALKDGYTACKTMAFGENPSGRTMDAIEEAEQRCKAVRDRVGDKIDLMLDCHGRCILEEALGLVQKLEKYDVRWLEEPFFAENMDALSELRKKSKIPIATGERLYTKWGFRELFEKKAAHIIQPDPIHCGGILETKKIAAMAEANYVNVAPHCPYFHVALAIAIQIDACTPNFLIQEGGRIRGKWLVKEPFEVEKGYIKLPTKPGLGIELDLDAIAERPYNPSSQRPGRRYGYMSYREDGSLNPR